MEYIIQVIIGLVVVIIGLVIEYRTKWFTRFLLNSNGSFDVGQDYREKPEPDQIIAEIHALPPAQRDNAMHNYDNLLVKWRVIYSNASTPNPNGPLEMYFTSLRKRNEERVVCRADLEQHPELKTLKQGHKLWLAGKIESIDHLNLIHLAPGVRFKFD